MSVVSSWVREDAASPTQPPRAEPAPDQESSAPPLAGAAPDRRGAAAPAPAGGASQAARSQRVYFLLAAFNVLSVLVGLWLSNALMGVYTRSVAVNAQWAERGVQYALLGPLAAAVNAPGNDVFASRDTAREASRLRQAVAAFDAHLARLRPAPAVAGLNPPPTFAASLDAVEATAREMTQEALIALDDFRRGDRDAAGARMAAMDRTYFELTGHIAGLGSEVNRVQRALFDTQLADAARLRRVENVLLALVLLMVGAAVLHGLRTARQSERAAREREHDLALLRSAQGALQAARGSLEQRVEERTAELHASVARNRQIIDSAHDAFIGMDAAGTISEWNPQAEATLGWSAAEAIGMRLDALIVPGPAGERHRDGLRRFLATGSDPLVGRRFESEALHRDGRTLYVEATISPIAVAESFEFAVFLRDITDRRAAQLDLKRLAAIVDSSDDAVFSVDPDGVIRSWNSAAERLFGYSAQEAIGRHSSLLVPAELIEQHLDIRRLNAGETVPAYDTVRVTREGERIAVSVSVSPLRDGDGGFAGGSVIARDIGERQRRSQEAEHREKYLVEAQRIARLGSWEWDLASGRVAWSDELYRAYGVVRGEFEPSFDAFLERLLPEDRPRIVEQLQRTVAECGSASYEYRLVRPDDSVGTIEAHARVEVDASGEAVRMSGTAQDISERKQVEVELERARKAAEAGSRAKSEFLANMSHEIRTPMNGVLGPVQLLLDSGLSKDQRRLAHIACKSAEALLALIDDILDFSKIEAGKLTLEAIRFDLLHAVEEVGLLIATRAADKPVEVLTSYPPGVPRYVVGDPGRIRQVLLNLGANAVKFTASGHVLISVEVESVDAGVACFRIQVQDSGIGIDAAQQDALFQKFAQADNSTTRRFGGSGLGLAISRQLVELMGGKIGVQSEAGAGSTFWFTLDLPLHGGPDSTRSPERDFTGARVLVVDDSAPARRVLGEQLGGWKVRHDGCDSATEALHLLRAARGAGDPYGVVIVDYLLPGRSGEAMARAINADAALAGTMLVMLTPFGERGHVERLREIGFAAYLVKPVRQSDLYDALNIAWSQRGERAGAGAATRHTRVEAPVETPPPAPPRERFSARVLVVEDNATNRFVASLMLRNLGCTVELAVDGSEAVRMIDAADYDMVFMDCEMPVMDGFEATAAIRSRGDAKGQMPIAAVTAQAMQGDRERCLRAGMNDYISKPVQPQAFADCLRRWVRAPIASS